MLSTLGGPANASCYSNAILPFLEPYARQSLNTDKDLNESEKRSEIIKELCEKSIMFKCKGHPRVFN